MNRKSRLKLCFDVSSSHISFFEIGICQCCITLSEFLREKCLVIKRNVHVCVFGHIKPFGVPRRVSVW